MVRVKCAPSFQSSNTLGIVPSALSFVLDSIMAISTLPSGQHNGMSERRRGASSIHLSPLLLPSSSTYSDRVSVWISSSLWILICLSVYLSACLSVSARRVSHSECITLCCLLWTQGGWRLSFSSLTSFHRIIAVSIPR
jgi:hypothetical protein